MINSDMKINSQNVSFGGWISEKPVDFTNVLGVKVLPKGVKVKLSPEAVLELSSKQNNNNFLLSMDDSRIKTLPVGKVVFVGSNGEISAPNNYNTASKDHLYIYRTLDGLIVEDISRGSTTLSCYKDYSKKSAYTKLPFQNPVLLNKDVILRLGSSKIVDFASPRMEKILSLMEPGRVYTLGSDAEISVGEDDPEVSKNHIEIMKLSGKLVVNDVSESGTMIYDRTILPYNYFSNIHSNKQTKNEEKSAEEKPDTETKTEEEKKPDKMNQSDDMNKTDDMNKSDMNKTDKRQYHSDKTTFWEDYLSGLSDPFVDKEQNTKAADIDEEVMSFDLDTDIVEFLKSPSRHAYRDLSKKWHPDSPSGAEKQFVDLQSKLKQEGYIDNKGHWNK